MESSEEQIVVDPLFVGMTRPATVWGVPAFPAALFLLWLALIVALASLVDRPSVRDEDVAPTAAPVASSAPTRPPSPPAQPPGGAFPPQA